MLLLLYCVRLWDVMSWLNHLLLFTDNGLSSCPRNIIIMNYCGLKRRVCGEQIFLRYLNALFSSHYVHRNKIRTFSLFGLSNDLMNTPNMKFLHPFEIWEQQSDIQFLWWWKNFSFFVAFLVLVEFVEIWNTIDMRSLVRYRFKDLFKHKKINSISEMSLHYSVHHVNKYHVYIVDLFLL